MSKLKIDVDRCKSCGYCVAACPKQALTFARNEGKLYATVEVDHAKCIRCGICYRVCPDYVFEIIDEV